MLLTELVLPYFFQISMKTKLLLLALLLTSAASFAQKTFDRAAFDVLMNRYAQDPVTFLKTEAAPDFVFAGSNSSFWNTERTGQVYERNTQTGLYAQNAEESAIKKACIDQHEAWTKRDLPALLAINAPVPYASRYWATEDGWIGAVNGNDQITKAYKDAISQSPQSMNVTAKQSNWQLKPLGENYFWATYDQVSTGTDGKIYTGKEARLLEKIGGQWKMVSVITLPLPKN